MPEAPPGLTIIETRHEGPVRMVYGAKQVPLGRHVQLVGLAPGVLPTSPLAQALKREGEILAKLDHPNIVRLYDLKHQEGHLWLVLEDVDGPPLDALLRKDAPWETIACVGLDLVRALAHAHGAGEAHGELHMGSVQLTRSGRTKLSGFGQMPVADGDGVEALKPQNGGGLSPEASIGQTVGPLSDLFAWGALMYELLCNEPPFGDPNDTHYASRVRNDRPKPLLLARPDVPAALEHVVNRCLEKLPSERPSHAAEVAEILEALVGSSTLPTLRAEVTRLGFSSPGNEESLASPSTPARKASRDISHPLARRFAVPLASAAIGAVLAGALVYLTQRDSAPTVDKPEQDRPLPTEDALLLRVVATPWAHVIVDGIHHETTPFARPITLEPGKHIVRLEHPHAAPEERVVEGRAGQAVLLDVQMHVERPLRLDEPIEVPEENSP